MSTKCHIHKYTARRKFIPAGLPSENPVGGNKSNTLYTLSYTEILSYTASLYNTVCGLWILIEIQKNKLCKFVDIVCVYICVYVCSHVTLRWTQGQCTPLECQSQPLTSFHKKYKYITSITSHLEYFFKTT